MDDTGERMIPERSDADTFWEHIRRYQFAAQWTLGKRVLDIACGEGYGSYGLLRAGAAKVIGVDVDQAACAHASKKYDLDVRIGSAEAIPLETGSVDVVVSFETVEHVRNVELFIKESSRVLSRGGMLIISTPDKNWYSPPGKQPNPFHCSEMTADEFRAILGKSFPQVTFFGQRPYAAKWWSPISLISEVSFWDRAPVLLKARKRVWARWNPERLQPVADEDRQNPASCIAERKKSWLRRSLDWSAVRPVTESSSWTPVFLIAIAQTGLHCASLG
jgi:SAM-dependent methyltransferase